MDAIPSLLASSFCSGRFLHICCVDVSSVDHDPANVAALPVLPADGGFAQLPQKHDLDSWGRCFRFLEPALRSFLLLTILSFARLLLQGFGFAPRQPRRNRLCRRSRSVLRGAPLALAIAYAVPLTLAAPPGAPVDATSGPGTARLASRIAMQEPFASPAQHASASTSAGCPDPRRTPACPPHRGRTVPIHTDGTPIYLSAGGGQTSGKPVCDRGLRFAVHVLQFQCQARWLAVDSQDARTAHDLVANIEDELEAFQRFSYILPVIPQPWARVPVLLRVPYAASMLGLTPVCIHIHLPDSCGRYWFDFVLGDLRLSDLRAELGDDWPDGARVKVGNRARYMTEDDTLCVQPGELIKVVAPAATYPRHVDLNTKLAFPAEHLDDFDDFGFVEPAGPLYQHGLLQILESPRIVTRRPNSPVSLTMALLNASTTAPELADLHWMPRLDLTAVLRGTLVASLAAAIPRAMTERTYVFIDPRELCLPVQVVASKQGPMHLSDFLQHIGMAIPKPDRLVVDGTVSFISRTRCICVRSGDLVVLRYDPDVLKGLQGEVNAGHNDVGPVDPAAAAVSPGVSRHCSAGPTAVPDRSRTPARSALGTTSVGAPAATDSASSAVMICKWNWNFTQHAPPTRSSGDTSDSSRCTAHPYVFVTDPVLQHHLHSLAHVPPVFQEGDLPHAPGVLLPGVPGEEQDGDTDGEAESSHSDPPAPRRVLVHVYKFQGVTRKCFLWVSPEEDLSSFMTRASILLNDDPSFVQLVPASPQPPCPWFSLLLVPRWWLLSGTCPLLCVTDVPLIPPFFHAAHGALTIEDVLPESLFSHGARLDVYVPPARPGATSVQTADIRPVRDLSAGALVVLQTEGAPPPVYEESLAHLRSLNHRDAQPELLASHHHAHSWEAVFLGTQVEQHIVRLRVGSVAEHAAEFLGVARSDLFIHRQLQRFDQLVVGGRDILNCFGFRLLSVHGGRMAGYGLFLDARAAGRPAAYRRVLQRRVDAAQLCHVLDIDVPEGYRPYCLGGDLDVATATPFAPQDGDTLVVWLDSLYPPARVEITESAESEVPEVSAAVSGTSGPDEPPSRGPSGPSSAARRSRSPRRHSTSTAGGADSHSASAGGSKSSVFKYPPPFGLRQLPTPARAVTLPSMCQEVTGPLPTVASEPTLLEAASCHVRISEVVAFLDAGSLPDLHSAIPACQAPTTISLAASVPVSSFQKSVLDLHDILGLRLTGLEQEDWLDADLTFLRTSPIVPLEVRLRCQELRTWWTVADPGTLRSFRVFTDGSADPECAADSFSSAAWAICVFAETSTGSFYVGHSAYTTAGPESAFHAGEVSEDALTAELLGIFWALAWIADSAYRYHVPVHVAYDCTAAGGGAFGHSQPPGLSGSAQVDVGTLAQAVVLMRQLASNMTPVYDSHVAGHSGVLGNEIVDLLAKRATKCVHNDPARVLPVWPAMLPRHQLKEWAWITASAFSDLPALYAFESEAFRLQRDDRPAPPPPAPGCVTTQPEPVRLCLKMMSYNTLTLLDGETARTTASAGMKVYGRRDVIKQQLLRECVGLVGLQETRLHQSQIAPDLHSICCMHLPLRQAHMGLPCGLPRMYPLPSVPVRTFMSRPRISQSLVSPRDICSLAFRLACLT